MPSGAKRNLLFPSDNGRKRVHVLETVIESKCKALAEKRLVHQSCDFAECEEGQPAAEL